MAKKDNIKESETQDEKLQKQEVVAAEAVLNPITTQEGAEQTDNQENQVSGESNEESNERVKNHIAELPKTQSEKVSTDTTQAEAELSGVQAETKENGEWSESPIDTLLETQDEQNHNSEEQKDESEEKDPQNTQTSKVEKKPHFIDAYKKAYPKEKLFYVTSDKQVFLARNKQDAKRHQESLKGGEIETIKVK